MEYAGAAYWEGRVLESGTKGGAPRSERTVDGEAEAARLLTQGMKALWVRAEELETAKVRKPLFEPGFIDNGGFARADIPNPVGTDAWDVVEVKPSTQT